MRVKAIVQFNWVSSSQVKSSPVQSSPAKPSPANWPGSPRCHPAYCNWELVLVFKKINQSIIIWRQSEKEWRSFLDDRQTTTTAATTAVAAVWTGIKNNKTFTHTSLEQSINGQSRPSLVSVVPVQPISPSIWNLTTRFSFWFGWNSTLFFGRLLHFFRTRLRSITRSTNVKSPFKRIEMNLSNLFNVFNLF